VALKVFDVRVVFGRERLAGQHLAGGQGHMRFQAGIGPAHANQARLRISGQGGGAQGQALSEGVDQGVCLSGFLFVQGLDGLGFHEILSGARKRGIKFVAIRALNRALHPPLARA